MAQYKPIDFVAGLYVIHANGQTQASKSLYNKNSPEVKAHLLFTGVDATGMNYPEVVNREMWVHVIYH